METALVIGWVLFGMLSLRFLVVLVNYASRLYLPKAVEGSAKPKVSVLIPARNEAANLPILLSDLSLADYPNLEIIVCNDHSTDETEDVLKQYQESLPHLSYFTNDTLPKGWIGKNYACHNLAARTCGDYLLFLDADVRLSRDVVSRAVSYAQKQKLGLLSLFPHQLMISRGEWYTVPVMNWILLSMLPLISVRLPRISSLAAANGQFMLFQGSIYSEKQWHRQVWNQNVEDIVIARNMKNAGHTIAVLTGNLDVMCRMYSSQEEALQGFSRNMHHFFGGSRFWMLLFVMIAWLRIPWLAMNGQWFLLVGSVGMLILMKMMVSDISRQSIILNLGWHFNQLWNMTRIAIYNIRGGFKREVDWKGRVYKV